MTDTIGVPVQVLGQQLLVPHGESLLVACEKAQVPIASSCRAGVCQSCLMRAVSGTPPAKSQAGLKPTLREQGYFLACLCRPEEELVCEATDMDAFRGHASITHIEPIGPDVVRVRWRRPPGLDFFAGQFLTFRWSDGIARSYSVASLPSCQETFDIHVRRVPGGQKSHWFHHQAQVGDSLEIRGPRGDCFYVAGQAQRPLLLIGAGTGIAPLYAIAKDALLQGHSGAIHMVQAGLSVDRLYFTKELSQLAHGHSHVSYIRSVKTGQDTDDIRVGDVQKLAVTVAQAAAKPLVYLCGDPLLVNELKKKLFLAGISLKDIYADAFIGSN